jgi:hypothetical protein
MSATDQLGGAAELGTGASRRKLSHRFALTPQRTRKGSHTSTSFDRHRFASQHRLVEKNLSVGELQIGGGHANE